MTSTSAAGKRGKKKETRTSHKKRGFQTQHLVPLPLGYICN
jgi:hypothetical protein